MSPAEPRPEYPLSGPMIALGIGFAIVLPIAGLAFGVFVLARGNTRAGIAMILVACVAALLYVTVVF